MFHIVNQNHYHIPKFNLYTKMSELSQRSSSLPNPPITNFQNLFPQSTPLNNISTQAIVTTNPYLGQAQVSPTQSDPNIRVYPYLSPTSSEHSSFHPRSQVSSSTYV
jgi:hypothetical protein